jgi:flagellar biosynthesis/type III secretory pathway protein FliH
VKREQNKPYLSVLERKALREGWEQGVQKGLQEGHEKGLQEGRAQGLQEGILTLLRTLYGAVPAELEAQLRAIRDVATLNALYPLAVSAGSLENFAQQLAQQQFLEEVKREQNTPYLSVLERKALREGWEQGVQKGLQEGHEKGLQEGRAQGLQEGRAQGLQEGILTLLRTLYGAVPAEVEAQLRAIRDVATLNALYPLAVSAGSLENFAQQLAQQQGD